MYKLLATLNFSKLTTVHRFILSEILLSGTLTISMVKTIFLVIKRNLLHFFLHKFKIAPRAQKLSSKTINQTNIQSFHHLLTF